MALAVNPTYIEYTMEGLTGIRSGMTSLPAGVVNPSELETKVAKIIDDHFAKLNIKNLKDINEWGVTPGMPYLIVSSKLIRSGDVTIVHSEVNIYQMVKLVRMGDTDQEYTASTWQATTDRTVKTTIDDTIVNAVVDLMDGFTETYRKVNKPVTPEASPVPSR
jgi:hypothetical protein